MIRRLFTAAILLACFVSLATPTGCNSVYAQGSYPRLGHQTLESLDATPRSAIEDTLRSHPEASDRVEALWQMARDFERGGQFEAAIVTYEQLRPTKAVPEETLTERIRWCRTRLIVEARWADETMRSTAAAADRSRSLGLFREVARTVHGNFVDEVPYPQIVRAGFDNLRAAMASGTFAERFNLVEAGAKKANFLAALDALDRELAAEKDMNSFTARYYVRRVCEENQRTVGLSDGVIIAEFVFAAAEHLDTYSAYLTRDMYTALAGDLEGHLVGLGVEVRKQETCLQITAVFPGSPASKAGLQTGDVIVAVDDHRVADQGLDTVVGMLRGERGTQVRVTVDRNGTEQAVTVTRDDFDVPSVRRVTRLGDRGEIGYLHLVGFQQTTGAEVRRAIEALEKQGPLSGLILDLRDNPGGLLTAAVDVCSLLLDKGTVVSTKGRGFGQSRNYAVSHWQFSRRDEPLVVLVDGTSASASEIVAAALKDHGRATLVGSRTFGKGIVQSVLPVELGQSAVYLTSARFYSPSGVCFHGVGVDPDVAVTAAADTSAPPPSAQADPATDAVLRKGLDVLAAQRDTAAAPTLAIPLAIAAH